MPEHNPILGLAAPEYGWVPTPSHVLRRAAILDLLNGFAPGRMLEIGCGGGAILRDLTALGYWGTAVDASIEAIELARKMNSDLSGRFDFRKDLPEARAGTFDYLMAFEVLEHIKDDAGALHDWLPLLKSGGTLVVSVPAHRAQWGEADEWAGHFRRYDRQDVEALLANGNCEIASIRCYGFPLLNLLAPVSNFANRRKIRRSRENADSRDRAAATARSGIDRRFESRMYSIYSSFPALMLFKAAIALQNRFLESDRGTGYLVSARKRQY